MRSARLLFSCGDAKSGTIVTLPNGAPKNG
jgi:hypothetical protein